MNGADCLRVGHHSIDESFFNLWMQGFRTPINSLVIFRTNIRQVGNAVPPPLAYALAR